MFCMCKTILFVVVEFASMEERRIEERGPIEKTVCIAGRRYFYFLLYNPISSVCAMIRPFMALSNADLVAFALRDSVVLTA